MAQRATPRALLALANTTPRGATDSRVHDPMRKLVSHMAEPPGAGGAVVVWEWRAHTADPLTRNPGAACGNPRQLRCACCDMHTQ